MALDPKQLLALALAMFPTMLTVMVGVLINNSRMADLNRRFDDPRSHMDARFDDMRVTWQLELRRVEQVVDARLKHLAEDR